MSRIRMLKLKSGMYMEIPEIGATPNRDNVVVARIFGKQKQKNGVGYNYWHVGTQEVEISIVEES